MLRSATWIAITEVSGLFPGTHANFSEENGPEMGSIYLFEDNWIAARYEKQRIWLRKLILTSYEVHDANYAIVHIYHLLADMAAWSTSLGSRAVKPQIYLFIYNIR